MKRKRGGCWDGELGFCERKQLKVTTAINVKGERKEENKKVISLHTHTIYFNKAVDLTTKKKGKRHERTQGRYNLLDEVYTQLLCVNKKEREKCGKEKKMENYLLTFVGGFWRPWNGKFS